MPSVTACIIAFNEEHNIRACLESVAFCDARLVIDSHSTDRTRAIAEELGATVIERDWPGHIEQKNFAIDQASTDWVLCIDCDERVTPEARARIEQVLADPQHDGYEVNRRNLYLGGWVRGGGWYPDRKLRLFPKGRGRWGGINPHDHVHLDPPGSVVPLGADIEHYTYRDISDHMKTIDYFATIAAQEKLARGQAFIHLNMLFNPPFKFLKMFILKGGFRDGWRGLVVAILSAFYVFLRYAKLWELVYIKKQSAESVSVSYARRGEEQLGSPPAEQASAEQASDTDAQLVEQSSTDAAS